MNFYETEMGQKFFAQQLPLLIEALQGIAQTRPKSEATNGLPALSIGETDILSDLYNLDYMPESMKRRENDPHNQEVQKAMAALLETLSPEQKELFLQYEGAENARGSSISCRAYKDGVRLAVQLIMAGCAAPVHTEAYAQPDCKSPEAEDGNFA